MANQKELSTYFTQPDVEGVYETQVPLEWRAVVELGCVCVVSPKVAKARALTRSDAYTLDDFDFKTTAEFEYLRPGSFHRIFFYHSQTGQRHTFGVFFSTSNMVHVIIVDPGRNEPLGNLKKYWREIYAMRVANNATLRSDEHTLPSEALEFNIRSLSSLRAAGRPLQQLLLGYMEEKHGPTSLVVQSPLHNLSSLIPCINEMPVIRAPVNSKLVAVKFNGRVLVIFCAWSSSRFWLLSCLMLSLRSV